MGVIVALLMILVLGALGGALTCTSIAETQIVGNYRASSQAEYAADAAIQVVVNHMVTLPDWTLAHAGAVASPFVDGAPFGVRPTPSGPVDLAAATNFVRAGPRGRMWQLYAYRRLRDLVPVPPAYPDIYVLVWIAGHPGVGGGDTALLLAHAYAPFGARRAMEAAAARTPLSGVRLIARREVY
jgi:hypothetical protein